MSILVFPIQDERHGIQQVGSKFMAISMCCRALFLDDDQDDEVVLCASCLTSYASPRVVDDEQAMYAQEWTIDPRTSISSIKDWIEAWSGREVLELEVTW